MESWHNKKINKCENKQERDELIGQYKEIRKKKYNTAYIIDNKNFKRIKYNRYADDFIKT